MQIADRLRQLRSSADLSLAALSEAVGMSKNHLHRLETGATVNPKMDTLERLAQFYRVTKTYLMGEE